MNSDYEHVPQPSGDGSLGVPCKSQAVSWLDYVALLVCCSASAVAIVLVLHKGAAMALGQTYQLVALGLLLSIMALCTQKQIQKWLASAEVRFGASTLQNLDAIIRNDFFASKASWQPRFAILFSLMLPLGLGAAYKTFTGGASERNVAAVSTQFGVTASPGYQLIGNGVSLLVYAYVPFWIHPAINRTYAFNLYVMDNVTTVIPDAPLPEDLNRLQSSLDVHTSLTITSKVNATVAEYIDLTLVERESATFWNQTEASYSPNGIATDTRYSDMSNGMLAGQGSNYSQIFLSRWNTTAHESFESQAERYFVTRRTCMASWNISNSNITLTKVTHVQNTSDAIASNDQRVIQDNGGMDLGLIFSTTLGEYEWTDRQSFDQPLPDSSPDHPEFSPKFNTRTPLVASMVWARISSYRGPERPRKPGDPDYNLMYEKIPAEILQTKVTTTLRRSYWLVSILIIHPILTVLAVTSKSFLVGTPVTDGFSVVSLLAGIQEEGIQKLRGAALSGKLRDKLRVRFLTEDDQKGLGYNSLRMETGSNREGDFLDRGKLYG